MSKTFIIALHCQINIMTNKYKELLRADELESDELSSIFFSEELGMLSQLKKEYSDIVTPELERTLLRLDEIEATIHEISRRLHPVVYMGTTKDSRNGIESIVGKTNWNKEDGTRVSLQVYVGRLKSFSGGVHDPIAKEIALDKMRKKIKELFPLK